MRNLPAPLFVLLLAACAPSPPAGDTTAAPSAPTPPVVVPSLSPTAAPKMASPVLQVAVLADRGSDSPFRWEPIEPGPPRTRREGGVLWAPAATVVHALKPGAVARIVDGGLEVDGVPMTLPTRTDSGDTWVPVPDLALALGGFARTHPDDGSVTLWPASALQWLRENGDPNAPVLLEARAAGAIP